MLKTCIGVGALLLAALTASAQANQCDNPCDPSGCDLGCGKVSSLWFYGGHFEAGLYGNNHGQKNWYDGSKPAGEGWASISGNTALLGPARMADLQMNQLYGYFGKKLNARCGWDVGGRIDFMYGTDAFFTQSNGLEYFRRDPASFTLVNERWGKGDYLASLPQAYGEVGYRNLSVKLGKFYTPLEGGAIMSPNRFFYSTSYVHGLLPITQTGAVATWDVNSRLTAYGGWTCGEDFTVSSHDCSTFANADNNAALFGFDYKVTRKVNFGYGVLMGKYNDRGGPSLDKDYFVQSFVIGIKPNRCWDYTFEWVLSNTNSDRFSVPQDRFAGYGINQELIYKLNRCWAFGLRGEWAHASDARLWGNSTSGDVNLYEFTLGTNWTPNNWLVVRPEIRYDYCDAKVFNALKYPNSKNDQLGFGVSTIVKF